MSKKFRRDNAPNIKGFVYTKCKDRQPLEEVPEPKTLLRNVLLRNQVNKYNDILDEDFDDMNSPLEDYRINKMFW